ncbi:helix-turn-helix domain-containing protein [Nocardioides daeguensis]|uniref:PucR family transcriptional regulator n=1 Tax=Nocardioides daeguensis TaxID=908359 RepID=A0ABP6UQS0_9ACTN|nr:helix-turn-helix domain-containing protein [Nocardioides daeguensis]MBV6728269.1 helix-turn-helix domain-containing protein [Nocardioides daeguensis]MCR1773078.1 helix-turn-helix domain-containing protein [Nocardioides daeguensis]
MSVEERDWQAFVDLIERVLADDTLLPQVVAAVRSHVQESATLPVSDITGHTRVLLTAAARALAGRRAPTEAELTVVEQLAVTRARQGIPIDVVLGSVRISERTIWARARDLAEEAGIPAERLLDARELYDDWADAVRARLIRAHRDAPRTQDAWDRDTELMRRLLEGGSAATLAAAERGFAAGSGLWVLVTRPSEAASAALRRLTEGSGPAIAAMVRDTLVAVVPSEPTFRSGGPRQIIGIAGPVPAEELGVAHRQAVAAVPAAEVSGLVGPVHIGDVAPVAALLARTDLAATVSAHHRAAQVELGAAAGAVAGTVRAWLEAGRDATAVARTLYVHENTVRNRVQRFAAVTGIDPSSTFGGVTAWWLCHSWMAGDEAAAGVGAQRDLALRELGDERSR